MQIAIFGTCQSASIEAALSYLRPGDDLVSTHYRPLGGDEDRAKISAIIEQADIVVAQAKDRSLHFGTDSIDVAPDKTLITLPNIIFPGFHPDCCYVSKQGGGHLGPITTYSSRLITYGFIKGLAPEETVSLFQPAVYEAMDWDFGRSLAAFSVYCRGWGLDVAQLVSRWLSHGPFMHTVNHPGLRTMSDIVSLAFRNAALDVNKGNAADYVTDPLCTTVWPIIPGLPLPLNASSAPPNFCFREQRNGRRTIGSLTLEEQVHKSFELLRAMPSDAIVKKSGTFSFDLMDRQLSAFLKSKSQKAPKHGNPYRGIADYQHWRKAIADPEWKTINPMAEAPFQIGKTDRIATAGSCFAQHIARRLHQSGFNYFVAEAAPDGMPQAEAEVKSYGLFSARYGNIYTVRQLLQLFQRAYGTFRPSDAVWQSSRQGVIDPFRPEVEPGEVLNEAQVADSREVHLAAVRRMFEELDVFVFTLGLTEAWRRRSDGAVFPLAPGVVSTLDWSENYEFVNFGFDEVYGDLAAFIAALRSVNANARIILTVSPVPLIATYEKRHVLTSTVASKSILRAAADQAVRNFSGMMYFPSYEIITMSANRGSYFENDLRSVRTEGVDHVMLAFFASCTQSVPQKRAAPSAGLTQARIQELENTAKVICDEEKLVQF